MKFRPGPGRVAVEEIDLSQEIEIQQSTGTKVMLYVANSDRSEGKVARVIAVAKPWIEESLDRVHNPEYDIGAIVVIGRWTGTTIQVDKKKFIVLREEDILGELGEVPKIMPATHTDAETVDDEERADDANFNRALESGAPSPL